MKKRFFAIISSIALFIALLPSAYADTYNN